jgi:4-aminobutyrate aminotransferase/(S)-3-amino-2-methylpropionate transaminase
MLALELVTGHPDRSPAPDLVVRTIGAARERGLLLLSCGLHGNVIRLLPPISIGRDDLTEALDALEASLRDASANH